MVLPILAIRAATGTVAKKLVKNKVTRGIKTTGSKAVNNKFVKNKGTRFIKHKVVLPGARKSGGFVKNSGGFVKRNISGLSRSSPSASSFGQSDGGGGDFRRAFFFFGAVLITFLDASTGFERSLNSSFLYIYLFFAIATISLSFNFVFTDRNRVITLAWLTVVYWFLPPIFDFVTAQGILPFILQPLFFPLWVLYSLIVLRYPPNIGTVTVFLYLGSFFVLFIWPLFFEFDVEVDKNLDEAKDTAIQGASSLGSSATSFFSNILTYATGGDILNPPPVVSDRERQGYYLSTSFDGQKLNPTLYYSLPFEFKVAVREYNSSNATKVTFSNVVCTVESDSFGCKDAESNAQQVSKEAEKIHHIPRSGTILSCKFCVDKGKHKVSLSTTYSSVTQSALRTHWVNRTDWLAYSSESEANKACGNPPRSKTLDKGFILHDGQRQETTGKPPLSVVFNSNTVPLRVGENSLFSFTLYKENVGNVASLSNIALTVPSALNISSLSQTCPFRYDNLSNKYIIKERQHRVRIKENLNDEGRHTFTCVLIPETKPFGNICSAGDFIVDTSYDFTISASETVQVDESVLVIETVENDVGTMGNDAETVAADPVNGEVT